MLQAGLETTSSSSVLPPQIPTIVVSQPASTGPAIATAAPQASESPAGEHTTPAALSSNTFAIQNTAKPKENNVEGKQTVFSEFQSYHANKTYTNPVDPRFPHRGQAGRRARGVGYRGGKGLGGKASSPQAQHSPTRNTTNDLANKIEAPTPQVAGRGQGGGFRGGRGGAPRPSPPQTPSQRSPTRSTANDLASRIQNPNSLAGHSVSSTPGYQQWFAQQHGKIHCGNCGTWHFTYEACFPGCYTGNGKRRGGGLDGNQAKRGR